MTTTVVTIIVKIALLAAEVKWYSFCHIFLVGAAPDHIS